MRKITGLVLFVVASAALGQDTAKPDYDKMKRDWQKQVEAERPGKIKKTEAFYAEKIGKIEVEIESLEKKRAERIKKGAKLKDPASVDRDEKNKIDAAKKKLSEMEQFKKEAIKRASESEPAISPKEFKIGVFGKLGHVDTDTPIACEVIHVLDGKSAVLSWDETSFILTGFDTAGLTVGSVAKPGTVFIHVRKTRLMGGSNYFVAEVVK